MAEKPKKAKHLSAPMAGPDDPFFENDLLIVFPIVFGQLDNGSEQSDADYPEPPTAPRTTRSSSQPS